MKGSLFLGLKRTWQLFAFSERIGFISVAMGFLVFSTSVIFAARAYRYDKESYLYEAQMLRARAAAMEFRAEIRAGIRASIKIADGTALPAPEEIGLARLPEGSEIFIVTHEMRDSFIKRLPEARLGGLRQNLPRIGFLARSADGDILFHLSQPEIPRSDGGALFSITIDGSMLFASGLRPEEVRGLLKRTSVQIAQKSNLVETTTTYSNGVAQFVVSYIEVPGTNALVFSEISLATLMMPFYESLQRWLALGLATIFVGGLISFFVTKAVAGPARLALNHLIRIANGDFSRKAEYQGRDEFRSLFQGIDFLASNILSREERLKLVGLGLQSILAETSSWGPEMTYDALAQRVARLLRFITERYHPTGFGIQTEDKVSLFHSRSLEPLSGSQDIPGNTQRIVVPIAARDGKNLMELAVFGVNESSIFPETVQTLTQMKEAIVSYFERRESALRKQEQIQKENEIAFAAHIQRSLISFPKSVPDVQLAYQYFPAEGVSGDWISAHFDEPANRLRFYVADATGHGVAASLVTAVVAGATNLFQNASKISIDATAARDAEARAKQEESLIAGLTSQLNRLVLEVGAGHIGMTMFIGSLDLESGLLSLCSLGHTQPNWFAETNQKVNNSDRSRNVRSNIYLGDEGFTKPHLTRVKLQPGEGIFLFTDGLVENYPESIKKKKLQRLVGTESSVMGVLQRITDLYKDAQSKTGPAHDDVAMLALQWRPKEADISAVS